MIFLCSLSMSVFGLPKEVLRKKEMRESFNFLFQCGYDFKLLTMLSFDVCNRKIVGILWGRGRKEGEKVNREKKDIEMWDTMRIF